MMPTAYDLALHQQRRRRRAIDARAAGADGVIRLPLQLDRIEATMKQAGRFSYTAGGRTISLIPIRAGWFCVLVDDVPLAFDRDLGGAVERLREAVDTILTNSR